LLVIVAESKEALALIWTLAEVAQCFAMLLLAAQVLCSALVANISGQAIALETLSLVCRLAATLVNNGHQAKGNTEFGSFSRSICSPWL
jgi:hypothetical protein